MIIQENPNGDTVDNDYQHHTKKIILITNDDDDYDDYQPGSPDPEADGQAA